MYSLQRICLHKLAIWLCTCSMWIRWNASLFLKFERILGSSRSCPRTWTWHLQKSTCSGSTLMMKRSPKCANWRFLEWQPRKWWRQCNTTTNILREMWARENTWCWWPPRTTGRMPRWVWIETVFQQLWCNTDTSCCWPISCCKMPNDTNND